MKPFLSQKAGASFYGGGNYAVVYHTSNIEIICKLQDIDGKVHGYTHIYMIFSGKDEIIIYANWNEFLRHLDSIKNMEHFVSIMKRPCPKFYSLLTEKHPADIYVLKLPRYDLNGIGKVIHVDLPTDYALMALPFRNDIADAIMDLSNELIDLYQEIEGNCPLPLWKDRLDELWY